MRASESEAGVRKPMRPRLPVCCASPETDTTRTATTRKRTTTAMNPLRLLWLPPRPIVSAHDTAVSSPERANACCGLLHCDVRRTSRTLRDLHVLEQRRIEFEDALDVLSKGRRHQPLSPRDVHRFV